MNDRAIAAIEIDPSGQLFVRPELEGSLPYEFIYREANGLRWHKPKSAFCAYEPTRWQHEELLLHIAATLCGSFNETLQITEATKWVGVSPALQRQFQAVLSPGQGRVGAA